MEQSRLWRVYTNCQELSSGRRYTSLESALPSSTTLMLMRDTKVCVASFKACLVARGQFQNGFAEFAELYAQIVLIELMSTLLSVARSYKWDIPQVDVKDNFLHAPLWSRPHLRSTSKHPGYQLRERVVRAPDQVFIWHKRTLKTMISVFLRTVDDIWLGHTVVCSYHLGRVCLCQRPPPSHPGFKGNHSCD